MNSVRKAVYHAIRDRATGHNGVACYASWQELADDIASTRRSAQEIAMALTHDGYMVRWGEVKDNKCFVPLDPDPVRRDIFRQAVANLGSDEVILMARAALLLTQKRPPSDVCHRLAVSCDQVRSFAADLRARGYWGA